MKINPALAGLATQTPVKKQTGAAAKKKATPGKKKATAGAGAALANLSQILNK
jgi:hypothetical protein